MGKLKYIEDYYIQIKERYPDLEVDEIDKILKHGFQSIFTLTNYGADIRIGKDSDRFALYFGKLFFNTNVWVRYRIIKWKIKLRIKYKHAKTIWDGNYYFGLTEEENKKYFSSKNGRLKSKIVFEKLGLCKIKEEAFLFKHLKYFYALSGHEDVGFSCIESNYSTRNVKLIATRDNDGKIKMI